MNFGKRALAEFVGTMMLLVAIVGSGVMAESLANGNNAIALLANSIATGAGLYGLILVFGRISGAHFNPVVSWTEMLGKRLIFSEWIGYCFAQVSGAFCGVVLTHIMFGMPILQMASHVRTGQRIMISEVFATFGLIFMIRSLSKRDPLKIPPAVALYIVSAYWCTSSTSFANPAVTFARTFTNTFCGIEWHATLGFMAAQFIGAYLGYILSELF